MLGGRLRRWNKRAIMEKYLSIIVNQLDEITNILKDNKNWLSDGLIPLFGVVLGFVLSEVKNWKGKTLVRIKNASITQKNKSEAYNPVTGVDEASSVEEAVFIHIALEIEVFNSSQIQKMIEFVGIGYKQNKNEKISLIYKSDHTRINRRNLSIVKIDPYSSEYYYVDSVIVKEKMECLPKMYLIYKRRVISRKVRIDINRN